MTIQRFLRLTVSVAAFSGASSTAYAFNPWEGADDATPVAAPTPTYAAPSPAPRPLLHFPAAYHPAAAAAAPASSPMSAAAMPAFAAAPAIAPTPAYTPPPMAPLPAPGVMPAEAATAYRTPAYNPPPPAAPGSAYPAPTPLQPAETQRSSTFRANQFALGAEGYYDNYREGNGVGVNNDSAYIGLTGDYTHRFSPEWFMDVSGRADHGSENYDSPSGSKDYIPQWEFEGRLTGGYDYALGNEQHLKPYLGFGTRYYRDDASGKTTSAGAGLYDRDILQMYAPVGVTYEFPSWGLKFAPNIEYGQLLYGRVYSHLGEVPGFYDITNKQESGYELRSDMLVTSLDSYGSGWGFGPFIRYWHFNNSNTATTPPTPEGSNWIEPENNRLQFGAEAKYSF